VCHWCFYENIFTAQLFPVERTNSFVVRLRFQSAAVGNRRLKACRAVVLTKADALLGKPHLFFSGRLQIALLDCGIASSLFPIRCWDVRRSPSHQSLITSHHSLWTRQRPRHSAMQQCNPFTLLTSAFADSPLMARYKSRLGPLRFHRCFRPELPCRRRVAVKH
jgi:hypothetical protein